MTVTRLGSLCTGIAGLELGLTLAGIETETVFVSDIDRGANRWLDANEAAPNLGDFTALDELPDVDLIVAGFPCQPVSTAGQRAGIHDERWLFDDITRLVSRMGTRPDLFLENVPGLLTANDGHAMARVVHGLADIGYHITWGTLSASAVGAPHRRNRWWGLATHADSGRMESPRRLEPLRHHADRCPSARPRARATSFGRYWPAVTRWETILGRPAPDPTDDGRLAPAFVEWMMGYPAGWVTNTLTNRREALHALGNAVVPQCAAAAFVALEARTGPS